MSRIEVDAPAAPVPVVDGGDGGDALRRGPGRRPALAGAVLGLATFVAYLPGLGRSLDFDSADTVGLFVRPGPPWAVFERQAVFNNHPMFSFLEQLVRVVTGRTDAAAMRVLPILFGAATVGLLTWVAARRHGLLAGMVAGVAVAANPTFAGLSRSVRGYSLLTLCALVSTLLVVADTRGSRGAGLRGPNALTGLRGPNAGTGLRGPNALLGPAYVVVAAAGLATHLYMVPVVAGHVGLLVARRSLDQRWRVRLLAVLLLSALAYAGMAATMIDATTAHSRRFQADAPWRVALMATGGGWASALLAPLVVAGAVTTLRSRAARGAAIGLGSVLFVLWAVMQSSALTERFFVWLVPAAAYLVAVAVGRVRAAAVLVALWAVVAVASLVPGYTSDLSGYRPAAEVIRTVNASGGRSCVVGVGVPLMYAYLDVPGDFAAVTRPEELDGCDLVVVAAWWPDSKASWFAADQAVLRAASERFPFRRVLGEHELALALSNRPLS